MEVSIGKFLDQMYQRLNLELIMLLGKLIMMHMASLDRSALPNQSVSCIETGEKLISWKNFMHKWAKESWTIWQLPQLSPGTMSKLRNILTMFFNLMALNYSSVVFHLRTIQFLQFMDLMSPPLLRFHWSISEPWKKDNCWPKNCLVHFQFSLNMETRTWTSY